MQRKPQQVSDIRFIGIVYDIESMLSRIRPIGIVLKAEFNPFSPNPTPTDAGPPIPEGGASGEIFPLFSQRERPSKKRSRSCRSAPSILFQGAVPPSVPSRVPYGYAPGVPHLHPLRCLPDRGYPSQSYALDCDSPRFSR